MTNRTKTTIRALRRIKIMIIDSVDFRTRFLWIISDSHVLNQEKKIAAVVFECKQDDKKNMVHIHNQSHAIQLRRKEWWSVKLIYRIAGNFVSPSSFPCTVIFLASHQLRKTRLKSSLAFIKRESAFWWQCDPMT